MVKDVPKCYQSYRKITACGLFDREYYLRSNLDVARACIDPIKHYLREGWRQSKNPNPYFDTEWYLQNHSDVKQSGINPLYHYLSTGWKKGYDPSASFSVKQYLQEHPELISDNIEPLGHFMTEQISAAETVDLAPFQRDVDNTCERGRVAIHIHAYYVDLVPEFIQSINHVRPPFDCFFTTDTVEKKQAIEHAIADKLNANRSEVRVTPNRGRDIAPFVVGCCDVLTDYEFICHVHTKKALHTTEGDYGNVWRRDLLGCLLGSDHQVKAILNYFHHNSNAGMLCSKNFIPIQRYLESDINQWNMEYLAKRLRLRTGPPREIVCPAGSMFWARTEALRNIVDAAFVYDEFDGEAGQLDGTLAHAFERLFFYIAKDNGFSSGVIDSRLN